MDSKRRIYKTKECAREARKARVSDTLLREAVERADAGTIYADLGDGLIKQEIARENESKRGGFRVVISYAPPPDDSICLVLFAKNDLPNIGPNTKARLSQLAATFRALDSSAFAKAIELGILIPLEEPKPGKK